MKYGYIRVSTKEQVIDRQFIAILNEGVLKTKIYVDRASGKDFVRTGFQNLLKVLKRGDEVYIKSIDRLGRNYDEIIKVWNVLTKEKMVNIIVLDFPLLDTRQKVEGVMGKFIIDLVLQILSYVAQVERENTHQRQMEGIKAAKKRGVKFGRPQLTRPENFSEVFQQYLGQGISLREGAKLLGVSHVTFLKWIKEISSKG